MDGMLYPWGGEWCDDDASDYDEEYLPCHREDVLFDLDSNGRRPTAAELAPLAWPHSCWWHDRDRIVLLYMHMLDNPPDGSFLWEARVCEQVHALWSDGRDSPRTSISYVRQGRLEGARPASTRAEAEAMREEGMRMAFSDGALPGGEDIPGAAFVVGRAVTAPRRLMTHQCFEDEAAPGLACPRVSSRSLPGFLSVFPPRFPTTPSSFLGKPRGNSVEFVILGGL